MSDESGVVPVDERVLPPPPLSGPGELLRAARLRQGLEIADVARQLKLFPRQVDAMERDDFAALPSLVFARGFIRNYARLLGLDAKALPKLVGATAEASTDDLPAVIAPPKIAAAAVPPPATDLVVPISLSADDNVRSRGWAVGGVVVVVAVVACYLIFHQSASSSNGSVVPVTLPQASVATTEPAPAPSSPVAPEPSAAVGGPALERPAGIPIPEVTTAPSHGAAAAAANPIDTGTGTGTGTGTAIRLSFTRDAWVEIRDRTGAVVFSQLSPAGAQRVVRGTPPFALVVGNASGVAVAFDGRDIDLAPYTRTDVAHLTLE